MIRIIGVQRNEDPEQEFVLLQNHASLRVSLRGHLVLSETAVTEGDLATAAHVFNDEALIGPGMYVLLATGSGTPRWAKTKDGAMIYYAFMGRDRSVWEHSPGPLHILSTHHTYIERGPALLLR